MIITPDLLTTRDKFGHTVIKVPFRNFKRVWEPHVDDKEKLKRLASNMTGPSFDLILKLDFNLDQNPKLVCFVVTCHERASKYLKNCVLCGLEVEK
ncbi:hypothetical protein LCGC14_2785870 [marine sediment metagenome]|uniref:Uncharacterized protein n=1 Tax=marine sediment metagenome TaxID=412755 RepID=A0A0F9BIG5_9ZZZZ